jgi:aminoglycoside phosphotransferase (APT) family kinase protein
MLGIDSSETNELTHVLGSDLLALIRARGVPVTKLTAITALPSPVRQRAAFAVDFADGTRLKARRLKSAQRADVVARLRAAVPADFPALVGRRGDAMLLAWVEGRSLASLKAIPAAVLRRCGRMLGALHARRCEEWVEGAPASAQALFEKLERNLELLIGAQLLEPDLAQRALAAADAKRPFEATLGIIHKDFCAENLVLGSDDSLVCVDDATLSTGPHDLDLARSWARWPMREVERAHFMNGYLEHRSPADFERHFAFWATCALVGSAATRVRSLAPGAHASIERLRELHAQPRR